MRFMFLSTATVLLGGVLSLIVLGAMPARADELPPSTPPADHRTAVAPHVPLYVGGVVATVLWGEPQARFDLQPHRVGPSEAQEAKRLLPPGAQGDAARPLLDAAVLVEDERLWQVLMPSLAQLDRHGVPRPEVGDRIAVVGLPMQPEGDTPRLLARILILQGHAYPLAPVVQRP